MQVVRPYSCDLFTLYNSWNMCFLLKYGSWKLQLESWNTNHESLNRTLMVLCTMLLMLFAFRTLMFVCLERILQYMGKGHIVSIYSPNYSTPDFKGHYYMFVVQVLVGRYTAVRGIICFIYALICFTSHCILHCIFTDFPFRYWLSFVI